MMPCAYLPSQKLRMAICKTISQVEKLMSPEEFFCFVKPVIQEYFICDITMIKAEPESLL